MPHDDPDANLAAAEAALHAAMKTYADAAARVHERDEQQDPFFAKHLGAHEVLLEASAFFASEIAAECRLAGERLEELRPQIIELVRSAHGDVLGALERELPDMLWAITIGTEHSSN